MAQPSASLASRDRRVIPARIHALLASESHDAVVIRRGPSKSVCFVHWDRREDAFRVGQWMHGRVYERRCDLSPDGRFLIYFAMNGRWSGKAKGSWTAISRAPYMKAIALMAKGDCWHGGGLFIGKRSYWLNDGRGHSQLLDSGLVRRDLDFSPDGYYGGECPGVYYLRLQRDGWALARTVSKAGWNNAAVFEKNIKGSWILRKIAHAQIGSPPGKGCYWDAHEIENAETKARIDCPDWEWAEVDQGRLVWAKEGCLFAGHLRKNSLTVGRLLFDFNDLLFEAVRAPY